MKRDLLPLLCLAALAALSMPTQAQTRLMPEELAQYRGVNRLLLVFAPSRADPRRQTQNALLKQSAAAFADRDLLRFDCNGRGAAAGALRVHFHVKFGAFRVLLIGKDGYVASSSAKPISVSELNSQIDRMPMRREEMRRRGR